MEFKYKTPLPKKSNYHYQNRNSCPKNYQSEKTKLTLPPINSRQYMNQQKRSSIKDFYINNISSNLNSINKPKIKYINSFSDARLPDEFVDQSYDNPQNE